MYLKKLDKIHFKSVNFNYLPVSVQLNKFLKLTIPETYKNKQQTNHRTRNGARHSPTKGVRQMTQMRK